MPMHPPHTLHPMPDLKPPCTHTGTSVRYDANGHGLWCGQCGSSLPPPSSSPPSALRAPTRTPVRVWVRDVLVVLACLCVVALTLVLAVLYVRVGNAVDRMAPAEPLPATECVGELPC